MTLLKSPYVFQRVRVTYLAAAAGWAVLGKIYCIYAVFVTCLLGNDSLGCDVEVCSVSSKRRDASLLVATGGQS